MTAGVVVLASGSAQAQGTDYEANLNYWSSYGASENQAQVLRDAAQAFSKRYPKVSISFTFNGRDNSKLLPTAIEAGRDIQMFDANSAQIVGAFSSFAGSVEPYIASPYPWTDGKPFVDYAMPALIKLAKDSDVSGGIRFVPMNPQAVMWFGNKAIFEKAGVAPPATWDELLAACGKINAAGFTPITTDPPYSQIILGYYLSRLKGEDFVRDLVNGTGQAKWDDPDVLQAVRAIESLAKNHCYGSDVEGNVWPAGQQDMVVNGTTAMYLNGTWLPNEVQNSNPSDFRWTAFAFPAIPGALNDAGYLAYGSYGIGVNKADSKAQTEAAVAFATFVNSEFDQEMVAVAKAIPVGPHAEWPSDLADARKVLANATGRYQPQTAISLNSKLTPILRTAMMKLVSGQIDAQEFVSEVKQ
ncbi:MAG: carbohydrate ABC transporter substrate-binding protein [Rhizobiaceae bacterium]|nr:carbohydrate ABC transporter substrate-binding protein [Rhizobiaceae bacterium]